MSLQDQIDKNNIPAHVAVIMDGNGRWAKERGEKRVFGHENAVKAVRDTVEGCAELGVSYLTLYAFSTENWNRPQDEVNAIMELLVSTIRNEIDTLMKNNIKLGMIGDKEKLPVKCQSELSEAMEMTGTNDGMTLLLALNYSGKWDITQAMKKISEKIKQGRIEVAGIDEETINQHLSTAGTVHPELLIRTSGEMRISNFLLWQLAYTELYFTNILWPDFRKENLFDAIRSFQKRERRFGKTSEQLKVS